MSDLDQSVENVALYIFGFGNVPRPQQVGGAIHALQLLIDLHNTLAASVKMIMITVAFDFFSAFFFIEQQITPSFCLIEVSVNVDVGRPRVLHFGTNNLRFLTV